MDEQLVIYAKDNPDEPLAVGRTDYYDNRYGRYKDKYCAIIDIILFNSRGEILFQKRGRNKRNGAGLLHTTVGGHINVGEVASFTVVHECIEELGAAALAYPKESFGQAFAKLGAYTEKAALLCSIGDFYLDYPAKNPNDGNIQDRIWFYLGRYDGPIENPDRSCAGYEWMDLATYRQELSAHPEQFTYSLKYYFDKFATELEAFAKNYCRGQK